MPTLTPRDSQLATAVHCAALTPELRSMLLFDADGERIEQVAQLITAALFEADGAQVERVYLGGLEDDDRLFGSFGMVGRAGAGQPGPQLAYRPGPLDQSEGDPRIVRLVLIPDLARIGLAAARACIMLMGAAVAHLERYDRQRVWQPNLFWLAACPRPEVAQVSLHLLERFALRLDAKSSEPATDLRALRRFVPQAALPAIPAAAAIGLREAASRRAVMEDEALEAVLRAFPAFPGEPVPSPRRPLALAWLALALARLEGAPSVRFAQVARAAALIGLTLQPSQAADAAPLPAHPTGGNEPASLPPAIADPPPADPLPPVAPSSADLPRAQPEDSGVVPGTDSVIVSDAEVREVGALGSLGPPGSPYPEDSGPSAREATPLRLPIQKRSASRAARGTIIGTMRADSFQDLALTATLIEASKYQAYRRRRRTPSVPDQAVDGPTPQHRARGNHSQSQPLRTEPLIVTTEDLRRYRRVPPPERLLVLLLDYTCLDDWDWGSAVMPYLKAAYIERAALCIVQVGAAGTRRELRASRVAARSLLAPAVADALGSMRGSATPLAHGLVLAHETLRTALHHGRTSLVCAQLVVVTDGRGNVPLSASREDRITLPVARRGIDDALSAAAQIKELPRVKVVLIHPSPRLYRDLPVRLGQALGAEVRALMRKGES